MRKFIFLLLCFALTCPVWAEVKKNYDDPKVAKILNKMIEVNGGQAAMDKLSSIKTVSSAEMVGMGMKMEITTISTRNKAKLETKMNGQVMAEQGYDGEVIWSKDMMTGLRDLKGAEALAIKQATLEHTLNATAFFDKISLGDDQDFNGSKVWVLLCDKEGMDTAEMYVGQKDYQMKGTKMVQESIQGKMTAMVTFDAYKKSKSGLSYVSEQSMKMGPMNMKITVTSYEENLEFEDKVFQKPN